MVAEKAVRELSIEDSIPFRDSNVSIEDMLRWVTGEDYPPDNLLEGKKYWEFRSELG